MNLKQQVCSLELAKRVKELGVKQESVFAYGVHGDVFAHGADHPIREWAGAAISAFTVAELGEMLLPLIPVQIHKQWRAPSPKDQTVQMLGDVSKVSEADARAKMLIYLLENKLISV